MPGSESTREKIRNELSRMEEDCIHSGKAHFNASIRWTRWNYIFGIPSVILSAAAGTAFFKDFSTAAGLMATSVTVLTALMTFLKPSERSSEHKSSGDQYLSLRNDARRIRLIQLPPFRECNVLSADFRRYAQAQSSPHICRSALVVGPRLASRSRINGSRED